MGTHDYSYGASAERYAKMAKLGERVVEILAHSRGGYGTTSDAAIGQCALIVAAARALGLLDSPAGNPAAAPGSDAGGGAEDPAGARSTRKEPRP